MTQIDDLIAESIASGAVFKTLGDVGVFVRGNGLQKSDLTDQGTPAIHYGQIHTIYSTWTTSTKSFVDPARAAKLRRAMSGDLVIATTSEDDAAVAKATAWIGDDEVAVSGDAYIYRHSLDPRYVAYFFQSHAFQDQKRRYITGTKVRRISGDSLAKIRIPVPAPEVQKEIVTTLDNFTELEATLATELKSELALRRHQYIHCRDALLDFPESGLSWVTMADVAINMDSKRKPVTKSAREKGIYPYYGASGVVDRVSDYIFDGDYLLVSEDGANLLARSTPIAFSISGKTWVNNHAHILSFPSYTERRFVEIFLNSIDLSPYITGGAQPKLNKANLNRIPLPWPGRESMERIVSILDEFDGLVSELNAGLRSELSARRRQYEYYRERLLTFEEMAA